MGIWVIDNEDIADDNRVNGHGRITHYGADKREDIALLPEFDGQNQGSTCRVLEDNSFWMLGSTPIEIKEDE